MRIFAHWTADRVSQESSENGLAEESGWVNRRGSREIYESRNDVRPEINMDVDDPDLREFIADLDLRHAEDNGDGTFYFQDEDIDLDTGDSWTYALHFTQKYLGPTGWVEREWHPGALW
jgi:hypothetical protein